MEIIKHGKIENEKSFLIVCRECKCKFICKRSETIKGGNKLWIDCPDCKSSNMVKCF